MYIEKKNQLTLVHKILRIKGNPQCCSTCFFLFTIIIDVKSVEREREMKRGAGMYQNISQSNHFCS